MRLLHYDVARRAGPKGFDNVDELIGQTLDRLFARPGDVRRENYVRPRRYAHQRMVSRRRLLRDNVEACAFNLPRVERWEELLLIDKPAACGNVKARPPFHHCELAARKHVLCPRHERAMEGDYTASAQNFVEWRVERAHSVDPLV